MFQTATIYSSYGRQQPQPQQQGSATANSRGGAAAGNADSTTTSFQQQHAGRSPLPAAGASSFSLKPRGWEAQAADVTAGLLDVASYRSRGLYAEVKVAEALDRAAAAAAMACHATAAAPEDCNPGQPPPNALVTAVACQLLGELAGMCGPFAGPLTKLRDALLPALHSGCAGPSLASSDGSSSSSGLRLNTLPWFALAGKLRAENSRLLEQQDALAAELLQHQAQMGGVEAQLLSFQAALDTGSATAAALQASNASLASQADAAAAAAVAAGADVQRLMAEVAKLTAELEEARDQLLVTKDECASEQEAARAQLDSVRQQLHVEACERAAALALAGAEAQEAQQQLWAHNERIEQLERELRDAQAHAQDSMVVQVRQQLTPRPSALDWGAAQGLAASCQSTREAVSALQQQHADTTAVLARHAQLLCALAAPSPAPQLWQLNLRADSSTYFITEQELDCDTTGASNSGASQPKLYAQPLGLSASVPRFLRWDQPVLLSPLEVRDGGPGLQELEQQVHALWRAKAAHEARHGPICVSDFLHHFFWAQAQQQQQQVVAAAVADGANNTATAAAAAAAGERAEQAAGASANNGPAAAEPEGGAASASAAAVGSAVDTPAGKPAMPAAAAAATAAAATLASAAAAGYRLYYSICLHCHESCAAELLWLVLTGQLPEAARAAQRQQLAALVEVAQQAVGRGSVSRDGGTGCGSQGVLWADVAADLQQLLPGNNSSSSAGQALSSLLAAACGSSIGGEGLQQQRVPADALAGVVGALQWELRECFGGGSGCEGPPAAAHALPVRQAVECLLRQHLDAAMRGMAL